MKLRLTENQVNTLQKYLNINETSFDESISKKINAGDILYFEFNDGTVNHFRVVNISNNQVIMDNLDQGSANYNYRYWFSTASLNGDVITLKRVHKIKQKDLLKNIRDWSKFSIKNINKILVFDKTGKKKDEIDIHKPNSKKNIIEPEISNDEKELELRDEINDLIAEILKLKEGYTINFHLPDGSELTFCAVSKHGTAYGLELINSKGNRDKYTFFTKNNIVMRFYDTKWGNYKNEIITTKDDGKTYSLLLELTGSDENGEGEIKTKDYHLDFEKVFLGESCTDVEEKIQNRTDRLENDEEGDSKEIMKMVLSDPLLKKAFISTPKLFGLIKVGDPKGIIPAENLLNKYVEKKNKERIGEDSDKFKAQHKILYELVDKPVKKTLGKDEINLKLGEKYMVRVKSFTFKDKSIVLYNAKQGYKIFIKKGLGNNEFKAVLNKDYIAKNGARESFTENITIRVKDYDY